MENSQICFSGKAGCPEFCPNPFKADMCKNCTSKIQDHSGATEEQVAHALEYAVDKEASLLYSEKGSLYLGGYKPSLNHQFLRSCGVKLIVNTAASLGKVLGPRYLKQRAQRAQMFPDIEEIVLNLNDDLHQVLDFQEFGEVSKRIQDTLNNGESVLVHCAQGKSRSASLAIFHIFTHCDKSIEESYEFVKSKRRMAEPNTNFLKQLMTFQKARKF
eukprot:TRINITY_DN40860_c0_g1_i1.p1 TRINITY_DN40860_c0_g1~~TRINITY_DN40860_c0_g1_i1.p1  ORF type:complete len:216 (-),score=39.08 TRINITY_DN40860_c0_g1_i1:84-731(-)